MPEDNLRRCRRQNDVAETSEDLFSPNRRNSVNDRSRGQSSRRASQEAGGKGGTVVKESIDFDEHRPAPKRRSRRKSSLNQETKRREIVNQQAPTESNGQPLAAHRRPSRSSHPKKPEKEEDSRAFTEPGLLQETVETKRAKNVKRSRRRSSQSKEENRSKTERDSEKDETAEFQDGLTPKRRSRRRSRVDKEPGVFSEEKIERRKHRRKSVNSENSASNDDDQKRRNRKTKKELKEEPDKEEEENKNCVSRSRRTESKRNSMSRRSKCQFSLERSSSNEDLEPSYNVASSSLFLTPKLNEQHQSPGHNEELPTKAEVDSKWIALKSNVDGSFERSFVRNEKNERSKNRRRQSRNKEEGSDDEEWPNYDSPSVTEKGSLTRIQKTNQGCLLPVVPAAVPVLSQTKPPLQRGASFDPLSDVIVSGRAAVNESTSFASLRSEEKQFFSCSSLGSLFGNDVQRTYDDIFTPVDCGSTVRQKIDHVASHNLFAKGGTTENNGTLNDCKKEVLQCLATVGDPADKAAFSISTLLENKAPSRGNETPLCAMISPQITQVATAENKFGHSLKTDLDSPQTARDATLSTSLVDTLAPSVKTGSDEMSRAGSKTPRINPFFSDQELGIDANRLAPQASPFPIVPIPKTPSYHAIGLKEDNTANTISIPNSSNPSPRSSKDFPCTSDSTGNADVATVPTSTPNNINNFGSEMSYSKNKTPSHYMSDILGVFRCKTVMHDNHSKQSPSIERRKSSISAKGVCKGPALKGHENVACDVIQCIAPLNDLAGLRSNTENSSNSSRKPVAHTKSTVTLPGDIAPKPITSDVTHYPRRESLCDVSIQSHRGALSSELSYSPSELEFTPRMSRDQFVIEGESRDKRSSSLCSKEQRGAGVGRAARECCSKCWKFDATRPWYLFSGKGIGWKIILSPLLLLVGPFMWVANMLNLTERIRASWENCWRCDHDEYWFSCKGKGTGLICLLIPIYLVLGPLIVIFTLLTVTFLACCGDSKPPDSAQRVSQIRAY